MSLKLVHLAADIEQCDDFHAARILLLLKAAAGRSQKPIQGIMKIAKMDFLLRYPNCLVQVLTALGKKEAASQIPDQERYTIEAKMIRFRYGPWDSRYRRWIGILVSKGLALAFVDGRTINVGITKAGCETAGIFEKMEDFVPLSNRCRIVVSAVGGFSATKLKEFVYEVFPEIGSMQWGQQIEGNTIDLDHSNNANPGSPIRMV